MTMRLTCLIGALLIGSTNLLAAGPSPEEAKEGFVSLFDGRTMEGWQGDTKGYVPEDGVMVCKPGGNVYTKKEYGDFVFRFEFKLVDNANNGVGIRTPMGKNAAYHGMEIQILDDSGSAYRTLQPYQYHGSIYGVVPCKRGHQETGRRVELPGDLRQGEPRQDHAQRHGDRRRRDLSKIKDTMDHQQHPGLHNAKGYIGFLGHGSSRRVPQPADQGAVSVGPNGEAACRL